MSAAPHGEDAAAVVARLGSDAARGLSAEEAAARLAAHGPNELPRPRRRGPARRLLAQFRNPLIYVLIAAAAVSAALGDMVDAGVIGGVVVINAAVGFVQESRAEGALRALMAMGRTRTVVVRDGRRREVDSAELAPGDLVRLGEGDRVPADVRLTRARALRVDESMLTGESVTADKGPAAVPADAPLAERSSMVFAGTLATAGTGEGVVVATGGGTELGRIQRLVAEATELETPLTRRIARFGRQLTVVIVALAVLTFALGLARGEPAEDMFAAAVALAVGAIPEGLPAAVTIALAIGVSRMAARRAIVRRLPAAETLGSTTVICSDKTGTLTLNRMRVEAVWAAGGVTAPAAAGSDPGRAVLEAGVLCNDARIRGSRDGAEVVGDPTEGALLLAADQAGMAPEAVRASRRRLDALPFSSERGWMATLDDGPGGEALHVKGATGRVLERCRAMAGPDGDAPLDREAVRAAAAAMARGGLRVLAVARGDAPAGRSLGEEAVGGLTLLGLVGMADPVRPEAAAAVAECRAAGIAVKMVTGDQLETARAIARDVGLAGDREPVAVPGGRLDRAGEGELPALAAKGDVFARVSPEGKLRLVEGLQARGHVVAMTGDGVNDAPALRQADLGVAMGRSGTEVAKEAADIILADDDFATIAAAVEEGRRVFDNIVKFIVWTLPTNLGEGLVILVAILLGATLPILPTQILWINMTTAVALGLPLAVERLEAGAMRRPPRDPGGPLLDRVLVERMAMVSALLLAGAYGLFELETHLGAPVEEARTVAVNVFVVSEAFYLLNCRSLTRSFLSVGALSNRWLIGGVALTLGLQVAFTYAPFMQALFDTRALSADSWLRIVAAGAAVAAIVGAEKALRRRVGGRAA